MNLKFYNFDIVFQEIPDEVTLAVNLTNCPHRCPQCHSPHLHQDIGYELNASTLDDLLAKYGRQITCFCFMGGDRFPNDVETLAGYLRAKTRLKVAWYSGNSMLPHNARMFDYIKIGGFNPERGGLRSRTTNQRLYRNVGGSMQDITHRFWKK